MQIKSKQRVANHGEVFTSEREVNSMLDLVKQETERIDSRFLEPACGEGNFLSSILNRKFDTITSRYKNSQIEFDKYSMVAFSSIYGIELLKDNTIKCRERLLSIFEQRYRCIHEGRIDENLIRSIKFILKRNIINGNALTLKTGDSTNSNIIFSEWSFINNKVKRRDFTYNELLTNELMNDLPLFSDLGHKAFIPKPIKEFPMINYKFVFRL